MKIKNELISVKIGNKQYDFNNLILDVYLKKFAVSQIHLEDIYNNISNEKVLSNCLLKFDTPFENLEENSELHNQDFDLYWGFSKQVNQIINEKQINIHYSYEKYNIWDYNQGKTAKISDYYGRKITAIGFNNNWVDDSEYTTKYPVCAVLDTSNYNIYLEENQELSITRKDIITIDALFYSSNPKYSGPLHLAPKNLTRYVGPALGENEPIESRYINTIKSKLYSIGLSSYVDYIDKEFVIGQDVEIEENGTEINIKGIENYLSADSPLFPSNQIYPSSNLYPVKSNYKYIILKYQIWEERGGAYDNPFVDTGDYYYQAIPIDKFGETNLKIKYERG